MRVETCAQDRIDGCLQVCLSVLVCARVCEWDFIYGAQKHPHKTLRIHSARCTQCLHVVSRAETTQRHSYQ